MVISALYYDASPIWIPSSPDPKLTSDRAQLWGGGGMDKTKFAYEFCEPKCTYYLFSDLLESLTGIRSVLTQFLSSLTPCPPSAHDLLLGLLIQNSPNIFHEISITG